MEQLPKSRDCQLLIEKTHELLEVSEALVKESRRVMEQIKQLLERARRQRMRSVTKWINEGNFRSDTRATLTRAGVADTITSDARLSALRREHNPGRS